MKPTSHEIAQYLDTQGVGVLGATSGWRLAANVEAASPDRAVTVYDTGGAAPVLYDEPLTAPTIQVRTRAHSYAEAYEKQAEVFGILNDVVDQNIGDHRYLGLWREGDILHAGRDEQDRHILTSNYRVERHGQ